MQRHCGQGRSCSSCSIRRRTKFTTFSSSYLKPSITTPITTTRPATSTIVRPPIELCLQISASRCHLGFASPITSTLLPVLLGFLTDTLPNDSGAANLPPPLSYPRSSISLTDFSVAGYFSFLQARSPRGLPGAASACGAILEDGMQRCFVVVILTLLGALLVAAAAHAHGVLGKRFTPSSLTVEDPFPSETVGPVKGHPCDGRGLHIYDRGKFTMSRSSFVLPI